MRISPRLARGPETVRTRREETGLLDKRQEAITTLGLKLTTNWSIQGSVRYDLDLRERIQDTVQLKYADECFVLTASYIETLVTNTTLGLTPDKTVMLRFELKHLGEFNYKTDTLSHSYGDQNLGPKL